MREPGLDFWQQHFMYNSESKPDLQIMLLCEMWPQDTGQFRPDT